MKKRSTGDKIGRCVKRAEYTKRFEKRYGMNRTDWVKFKKTATKAEVHQVRQKALARI